MSKAGIENLDNDIDTAFSESNDYVKQHGVEGIDKFLEDALEKWKQVDINIAVVGNSGSGKSSFINTVRGWV